jgi:hypothetical protein
MVCTYTKIAQRASRFEWAMKKNMQLLKSMSRFGLCVPFIGMTGIQVSFSLPEAIPLRHWWLQAVAAVP